MRYSKDIVSETENDSNEIDLDDGLEEHDPGVDHEDLPEIEGVSGRYVEPILERKPAEKPVLEILKGLKSTDDNYRLMSYLFFASLVGVVVALLFIVQTFLGPRPEVHGSHSTKETAQHETKDAHEAADSHAAKDAHGKPLPIESDSLSLGVFNFDLNFSQAEKNQSYMKGAELEVTVMCDKGHTCTVLKEALPAVRDKISGLFYRLDKNDLMSKDGKARLRKRIVDAINQMITDSGMTEGKVVDAFFPHLVLI